MGVQGIREWRLLDGGLYWGFYCVKGLSSCHSINGNPPAFFWYDTDIRKSSFNVTKTKF